MSDTGKKVLILIGLPVGAGLLACLAQASPAGAGIVLVIMLALFAFTFWGGPPTVH